MFFFIRCQNQPSGQNTLSVNVPLHSQQKDTGDIQPCFWSSEQCGFVGAQSSVPENRWSRKNRSLSIGGVNLLGLEGSGWEWRRCLTG